MGKTREQVDAELAALRDRHREDGVTLARLRAQSKQRDAIVADISVDLAALRALVRNLQEQIR